MPGNINEGVEGRREREGKANGGLYIELVVTAGNWRSTLLGPSKESPECSLTFSLRGTFICLLASAMDEIALRY